MDSSSLHRNPSVKWEVDVSRHKVDRSELKNGQFGWYHGTRKRLPSHLGREVFVLQHVIARAVTVRPKQHLHLRQVQVSSG